MDSTLIMLIKRAIGERTLNGFCAEADLNAGNLSRVLRGQKISADLILKIAENAQNGVTAEDLFCAAGYIERQQMGKICIYGTVAAGLPIAAYEEFDGTVDMNGLCGVPEDYFALRVRGNSMDNAYMPDGCVVVARKQTTLEYGEIGVFMIEGEATVKKFLRSEDYVLLMPISSDAENQPQVYGEDTNIQIIGKVVKSLVDI
ncbi:MAG: S24 family peptidase [Christensenellaceae bacterium]